mgnify:CR=1 FL=1
MEEENIITVRNRNLQKADEAFADFMFMLESYLNEKAAAIPGCLLYTSPSPRD